MLVNFLRIWKTVRIELGEIDEERSTEELVFQFYPQTHQAQLHGHGRG